MWNKWHRGKTLQLVICIDLQDDDAGSCLMDSVSAVRPLFKIVYQLVW